jgi:hypothetical protein
MPLSTIFQLYRGGQFYSTENDNNFGYEKITILPFGRQYAFKQI